MDLTELTSWDHDGADLQREEAKRWSSPSSFFWSQGHALVLAARYFANARLVAGTRDGVARKHRLRIHLALFGQLLASLEFILKDFIAQVVDHTDRYDEKITKASWVSVDASHILSARATGGTIGTILLHNTMGWQDAKQVNKRYADLFGYAPIDSKSVATLERLWVLRHSVAHNAGFVTSYDAARTGLPHLAGRVVNVDEDLIADTFGFLGTIADRVASTGDKILLDWLRQKHDSGAHYMRDKATFTALRWIATSVHSRTGELPRITKGDYTRDMARAVKP
jgi:hypothetical protein